MNLIKIFKNGIINENPTFRLVLGTCPTLAITTSAINGVGMGLSTTAVLIGSNMVISLLRKFIPAKVRIPAYVTVIAGFVTIVQMLLKAYVPTLDKALGIYIPLIVVNCIILARAEAFASKNGVVASAVDGLGMGLGFTMALTLLGSVREILGNGSIFGLQLLGESASPALCLILPPGGFLVFGLAIGLVNLITSRQTPSAGCGGEACAGCKGCSLKDGEDTEKEAVQK
jgi:electron transport complex protein RnfE